MSKLGTLFQIGRTFGLRDGTFRLSYELQRASGWMSRRLRAAEGWDRWDLKRIADGTTAEELLGDRRSGTRPFFFADSRALAPDLERILGSEGRAALLAEAESIIGGSLPFFGRLSFHCGVPPDWFRNPATGQRVSPQRAWTSTRFESPDYGDLKFILESSRFLFIYPLARAYALTADERYAEAFWLAIEDWAEKNPPMAGPLWICGQESSLRIVAWSFALYAFVHAAATSPERVARLFSMIAAHAWRTELTLAYARSQRSNHLVSEAVGLWTAGTLYPELIAAQRWQSIGTRMLQEAALDQITPEGVHMQDSFNYQRMVLQQLLWTLKLAEIHNVHLSAEVRSRTAAALSFMRAVIDPVSGHAPNHGSNDGSLILPLSSSDYGDFRPLLQLGSALLFGKNDLPPGPWNEATLWLYGKGAALVELESSALLPPNSGYHRLGTERCWAMIRAGHYNRRPYQADQLHVDLWSRGINIACDPGTYLYNGDPPWNNGLAGTAVHNTVTVDGHDQMRRAGKFLWVDWAQASGRSFVSDGSAFRDCFEGEHAGYRHFGVRHLRSLRSFDEDGWVIVDDLLGSGEHELRLHWLLPDVPFHLFGRSPVQATFDGPQGSLQWNVFSSSPSTAAVVRAGKSDSSDLSDADAQVLGWESPTYGELRPAISLLCRTGSGLPVRFTTIVLISDKIQVKREANQVELWRGDSLVYRTALGPRTSY